MGSPKTPPPPDIAAANEAAVYADVETLPIRKMIESAAALGTSVTYTDPKTGEQKTADFSGFGDIDQTRAQLDFMAESARTIAKSQLDVQKEFGAEFIQQRMKELELSDPQGTEIRKLLGAEAKKDLEAGYGLGDDLRREVTQAVRGAQAARGNIMGDANAAAEAFAVGDAAIRLRQQRLANAASFLSGITPVAQFGAISGAQQGAAGFNPMGIQQGTGINQNAMQIGSNFAMQSYQQQSQNAIAAAEMNPWNTVLGTAGGLAMAGLGGGVFGSMGGAFGAGASGGVNAFLGGNR
jgi:hypothetical protein